MLETHPRAVSSCQTVSSSPKFMDNLQGHLVRGCSDYKRHLGLRLSLRAPWFKLSEEDKEGLSQCDLSPLPATS